MIKKRPKFQRVICWPINFWRAFRIGASPSIKDRVFTAALMANLITKN
jgi:hypothetical protein